MLIIPLGILLLSNPTWGESPKQSTIQVGYIPIGDCIQLYVAEDMGFFKEEGLKVQKRSMKGGAVIIPAVEAGEVDIGWSNSISIIIAHSKGFNFEFLTSGALSIAKTHRVHSLLVRNDSDIEEIVDLEGKKVAINTLGNINELSLVALADQHGLDIKKVQILEVPFPNMETALKTKSVHGILAVEPFVTLSLAHETAKMLVPEVHENYGQRFMIGSWFAKTQWVENNPELAARFIRAINKASKYLSEHDKEALSTFLVGNTKLTSELIEKITLPAFSPKLETEDLRRMIDITAKYQFIPQSFSVEDIVKD